MLASALGTFSNRLDAKFLTAYWLPAFVGALGTIGIVAALAGSGRLDHWVSGLDAIQQSLAGLLILLLISMLAFMLRALTATIAEIFAGDTLPNGLANWSTRGQLRLKRRAMARASILRRPPDFPHDDADTQPTRFGNVLATAAEYPRHVYAMDSALWWPRLRLVAPAGFDDALAGAQAPTMALLNLSVVFAGLAVGGALALALGGGAWTAALVLVAGLVLSRGCYRLGAASAGVRQPAPGRLRSVPP